MSTLSLKKETLRSIIFRFGSMAASLLTTSLLIRHLGASNYGIWATLISLLSWIQVSDFGVGYALKNRIASNQNSHELIDLVSGIFQFFTLVSICLAIIFFVFGGYLKIVQHHNYEANILYITAFIFFPLTIGISILQGLRKTSVTAGFGFAQAVLWVCFVLIIVHSSGKIFDLSIAYVLALVLTNCIQFIVAMNQLSNGQAKWRENLLEMSHFHLSLPLVGIGVRFIVLQLTNVILFSLGTYLVYSNLSAAEAGKFDILFKFYQVPLIAFSMIIAVFWTEIAREIALRNGLALIKRYKQLLLISLAMGIVILFGSVVGMPTLIKIYSGNRFQCSASESLTFGALIVVQIFAYSGAVFLNAAENLKGQTILAVSAAVLLVPLALYFFNKNLGVISVPLATTLLTLPGLLYCNWAAYHHVIKKTGQIHI
jgi:O-antigen/teichoic acid export membrane protein